MTDYESSRNPSYTDEELIERYRSGIAAARDELLDRYKGIVRGRARCYFLLGADDEDLIQEGMIGLIKAIDEYDAGRGASFKSFAWLCVERHIYTVVRDYASQKHSPLNSALPMFSSDVWGEAGEERLQFEALSERMSADPETVVIGRENARVLQERMAKQLSRFERQVLEMYLDGENYREIGERLKKEPKSIDNALQRIRAKVRHTLEEA